MSIETTPYGDLSNGSNFREAQNLADQGVSDPKDLKRLLEICQSLENYQLREILFHCCDAEASIALLCGVKTLNHIPYLNTAMACAKKEKLTKKHLALEKYAIDNNLIGLHTSITLNDFEKIAIVFQKANDFIRKNHKVIENILRSSYWHYHHTKYPLDKLNIHVTLSKFTDGKTKLSLIVPISQTYVGKNSVHLIPMVNSEIDYDDLDSVKMTVNEIAIFQDHEWLGKLKGMSADQYHEIKCQNCKQVINVATIPPEDKLILKNAPGDEDKCFKCRQKDNEKIDLDDYYEDWCPLTLYRWIIPGSQLIFDSDDPEIKQKLKDLIALKQYGNIDFF